MFKLPPDISYQQKQLGDYAQDISGLEDYARLMFPKIVEIGSMKTRS